MKLSDNDSRTTIGQTDNPKVINRSLKQGAWNNLTIRAEGNRLRHWLNGHLAIEAFDKDTRKAAAKGLLAFQLHAGRPMRIEFRILRLRPLASLKSK